jgi:hypothetical protein
MPAVCVNAGGLRALSLPAKFVQLCLRCFRSLQRFARPCFRLAQTHAAVPQGVKMIALIYHRLLSLGAAFFIHQRDALLQALAAVARHLFQIRQDAKLLPPSRAADFGAEPPAYPTQALRFHHHQHRRLHVNLIAIGVAHQGTRPLVEHRQQLSRLFARCLGAATQGSHA